MSKDKQSLRKAIKEIKRQYSVPQLKALSKPIAERLMAHPRIKQACIIFLYYSMDDEVYTHDAIETLYQAGKTILLPVVEADYKLTLRRYNGPKSLKEGPFHILEPTGETYTEYEKIDVAVVPGMAFDGTGHRLGRGKGYYDRLLKNMPQVYKIGICFGFQKQESIPAETYDISMNEVL